MELTERLRAALDEDERIARQACHEGKGQWSHITIPPLPSGEGGLIEDERGEVITLDGATPSAQEAIHIARHDPARVLRQAAAHREILTEHVEYQTGVCMCLTSWPCVTVLALARAYGLDTPNS